MAEAIEKVEEDDINTEMRVALDAAFEESEAKETDEGVNTDGEVKEIEGESEGEGTGKESGADGDGKPDADPDAGTESEGGETDSNTSEQVRLEKAPQSWSPADREAWKDLPANVKAQVHKREQEVTSILNESSEARNHMQGFNSMMQPYSGIWAAQNTDPISGIKNVLDMTATLQMGTPQQKANAAARVIREFGVDIKTLDGILVGRQQQNTQSPEYQQLNQRFTQMEQHFNSQAQQRNSAEQVRLDTEVNAFLKENEFADDLRNEMADAMDLVEKRGQKISLKQAYDMALATRPDIQGIISSRNAKTNSETQLNKARKANVSVAQNGGAEGAKSAPTSIRAALEDAWGGD